MNRRILAVMAEKGIARVPTFSPLHFQLARPEIVGWNASAVDHLKRILDAHLEHLAMAADMGVAVVAGSDAGSHGVGHGTALIDELFRFLDAGLSMAAVLRSATSLPRRLWKVEAVDLAPGNRAEFVALAGSPWDDPGNLRRVNSVFKNDQFMPNS